MRTRMALYNTVTSVLVQVASFMIGIVMPRFIISQYGSSLNGLRSSVSQFIDYLTIIEMGLGGALIFSLYDPIAANDQGRINSILSAARQSYKKIGVYFAGLALAMTFLYPLFVVDSHIGYFNIAILVMSIGASNILDYFTVAKYKVLLVASQASYVISIINVVYLLVNTLLMIVLIQFSVALWYVYLVSLAAKLVQISILTEYTKRRYSYISFFVPADVSALSKRYDIILHQISGMIVAGSPILLLTLFRPLAEVSVYSIYALVFTGITMIISVFNNGLSASFGQIISQKKWKTLEIAYSEYEFLYYMIVTFVYSCATIMGLSFITIYTNGLNDTTYVRPVVFVLFMTIGMLDNWKIPQTTIITSSGHFRQTRHRAIIEAVVTLAGVTLLVCKFGIEGVLWGSIAGLGYRAIDLTYPKKIANISAKTTCLRLVRMIITGFVIVLPFQTLIYIDPSSFVSWVEDSLLVSSWAGVVVLVVNTIFEKHRMTALLGRLLTVVRGGGDLTTRNPGNSA